MTQGPSIVDGPWCLVLLVPQQPDQVRRGVMLLVALLPRRLRHSTGHGVRLVAHSGHLPLERGTKPTQRGREAGLLTDLAKAVVREPPNLAERLLGQGPKIVSDPTSGPGVGVESIGIDL